MRTPLYEEHVRLHGRIVDFHGWELPVWYRGIVEEHMATRNAAGLFDVSHMGEIMASGKGSVLLLDRVLTIDVGALEQWQVKYALLLNEHGGVIDDLLVYCINPGLYYMLCVNATNTDKDLAWLNSQNSGGCMLANQSPETAMLALQGPDAGRILSGTLGLDLVGIRHYHFTGVDTHYGRLTISRTGYTGSDGVEIFLARGHATALWNAFVAAGATPCGLGARDTLRLEMGYPLHGNDIDENTTPIEAQLFIALNLDKAAFIGKEALEHQLKQGITRHLTGLTMIEKVSPARVIPVCAGKRRWAASLREVYRPC